MEATRLDTLQEERIDLRSQLARAWELREPLDQIKHIEQQIQSIWNQIEAFEEPAATSG